MKAENQRAGIFRRTLSKLTRNWGLKLLALIMAIIVYYSLKPDFHQDTNDRQLFQHKQ